MLIVSRRLGAEECTSEPGHVRALDRLTVQHRNLFPARSATRRSATAGLQRKCRPQRQPAHACWGPRSGLEHPVPRATAAKVAGDALTGARAAARCASALVRWTCSTSESALLSAAALYRGNPPCITGPVSPSNPALMKANEGQHPGMSLEGINTPASLMFLGAHAGQQIRAY